MKKLTLIFVFIMLFPSHSSASEIVYYSQKDSRWANVKLYCQGGETDTVYRAGCGETVVSMLLSTYVDSKYTPDVVVNTYFSNGYFCHGTDWAQDLAPLRSNGFAVIPITSDFMDSYLLSGWLIFANVPNHYVLIVGIDKNGYIIYDPFYGTDVHYGQFKSMYAVKYISHECRKCGAPIE
jgi:hypothetical protein